MSHTCYESDERQATYPCVNCLSEKELWAFMVQTMAHFFNDSPTEREPLTAGYRNLSDLEFLRQLARSLPSQDIPDLTNVGLDQCLMCYGQEELKALFLFYWCSVWNSIAPDG